MKYNYYITIWTPVQFFGMYYRNDRHPLIPEVCRSIQKDIATKLSLANPQMPMLPVEAVVVVGLYELPEEVIQNLDEKARSSMSKRLVQE